MNKSDLAKSIALSAKLPKNSRRRCEHHFRLLSQELSDGGRYRNHGASAVSTPRLTKREKDEIRTGEAINVPEKTHVLFRVGKELKGRVDAD